MMKITYGSRTFIVDMDDSEFMGRLGSLKQGLVTIEHTKGTTSFYIPAPVEFTIDHDYTPRAQSPAVVL